MNFVFIKSVKLNLLKRFLLFSFIIFISLLLVYFGFSNTIKPSVNDIEDNSLTYFANVNVEDIAKDSEESSNSYIKWVEFNGSATLLKKLSDLDISSHSQDSTIKLNWIELMSYLGCKYGGNLKLFKQSDLDKLVSELNSGKTMEELTFNMKVMMPFFTSLLASMKSRQVIVLEINLILKNMV